MQIPRRALDTILSRYVEFLVDLLVTVGIGTTLAVIAGVIGVAVGLAVAERLSPERIFAEDEDKLAVTEPELDITLALYVTITAWMVVVPALLAGYGWLSATIAGIGLSFVTAAVVAVFFVEDAFPGFLQAKTILSFFSDIRMIGMSFAVMAATVGSYWWVYREMILYDLPSRQRTLVESQVTEFAFWIVFPLFSIMAMAFGCFMLTQTLFVVEDRLVDAVATITNDDEREKLSTVEEDIKNRFYRPLWTGTLVVFVLLVLMGWDSVSRGESVEFGQSLKQYRSHVAIGFELFMISVTIWFLYLLERTGLKETTIRKVLKRQVAETVYGTTAWIVTLLIFITAVEPTYEWAVQIARQQLGQGMDYFTPTAQSVLADQPVTPTRVKELALNEIFQVGLDPFAPGLVFARFLIPVGFLVFTTPVLTLYLYFSHLRSIAAAFVTYIGFSLLGVVIELLWTGKLLELSTLGVNSLLPTGTAIVVIGTVEWYTEQLQTISCPECDDMIPANNTYCPECGTQIGGYTGRE